MIIIRPNKPLPLLSANQHFPFAFLSSCKGNIASSTEAKRIGQPKHSFTRTARPPSPGRRGPNTTLSITFWNGPPTLRLPPNFCFLSPTTHPNQIMPSFRLPLGRGSGFQRLLGHLSCWGFSFVFILSGWCLFPDAPCGVQVNGSHFWFCWRF